MFKLWIPTFPDLCAIAIINLGGIIWVLWRGDFRFISIFLVAYNLAYPFATRLRNVCNACYKAYRERANNSADGSDTSNSGRI